MPSSPDKICRDCSSRALAGTNYCGAHAIKNAAAEYRQQFDKFRAADDPIRKLYRTARWRHTRVVVFRRDILCKGCGHRASTECDHYPLEARQVVEQFGQNEFFNADRCQGLCHDCHSQKTATTVGFAKRTGRKAEQCVNTA